MKKALSSLEKWIGQNNGKFCLSLAGVYLTTMFSIVFSVGVPLPLYLLPVIVIMTTGFVLAAIYSVLVA